MRAVATGWLLCALTGCFYVDPIVTRPQVQIEILDPGKIYRGGSVTLAANFTDAGAGLGTYDWKLYTCTEFGPTGAGSCDDVAFYTATATRRNTVNFSVPVMNMSGTDKTQAIRVDLEARSDRGALAQAAGQRGFEVLDAPPTLMVDHSAITYTVGAPIDLFAKYSDPDDELDAVAVTWEPTPAAPLEDLPVPAPAGGATRTVGVRLVPGQPGAWTVKATARDPLGMADEKDISFTVDPDRPPCLAQWQPIVPPDGASLPVTAPTVFQVPLVDDDLDAYPAVSTAPQFGTTSFAWSILPPGAAQRQPLAGATANLIDFDPAAFTPGDIVELRVEIFDRQATPLPCDDAAATCSITSSRTCIQRQTWRVEVR